MSFLTSSLLENFDWLEHGFGTRQSNPAQTGMASVKQIHSDVAFVAHEPGCVGEGDALLTRTPGIAVSVRTADCFPILLVDRDTRAVAAVHAGWRGTAAGILATTLARMRSEFGTEPGNVLAAIGPGIGQCCYEVGLEVARQFGMAQAGKLDLAVENRDQLVAAGVQPTGIELVGGCTFCHPAQFYSWRRDRDRAGRMVSFIRVTAPALTGGA
ncbi:MAG: peptidoglycan editing factor PgeF [Acidobacteriia bacterium]|nr:peptidoglycan editing factor PgeF [Terriglobia bacterium]